MFKQWNDTVKPWLKIAAPKADGDKKYIAVVKSIAAVRSNISGAVNFTKAARAQMQHFSKCLNGWRQQFARQGYEIYPEKFGNLGKPVGTVIYTSNPRISAAKTILVVPGLKKKQQVLLKPVSAVLLPTNVAFPSQHPHAKLSPLWRGILGELELLLKHLEIQKSVVCSIESIDRSSLVPVAKARKRIVEEIRRREASLRKTLEEKHSDYQLATNYWRIEECFWGIFHDDERPQGYSFFDILRRRTQDWRGIIRRKHRIMVRDFIPHKENIGSINKEIGSMVLKRQEKMAPGTVLRQLRPAVMLREKNTTRTLTGRVMCT